MLVSSYSRHFPRAHQLATSAVCTRTHGPVQDARSPRMESQLYLCFPLGVRFCLWGGFCFMAFRLDQLANDFWPWALFGPLVKTSKATFKSSRLIIRVTQLQQAKSLTESEFPLTTPELHPIIPLSRFLAVLSR